MDEKFIGKHVFCFNPDENGGESVTLTTTLIHNGDHKHVIDEITFQQELTLMSYGNSATFNLFCMTPDRLRLLANELEIVTNKALGQLHQ